MDSNAVIVQKEPECWLVFTDPLDILHTKNVEKVGALLDRLDQLTRSGLSVAGFLTYEAARGLDPAFRTHPHTEVHLPLAWFGVYRRAHEVRQLPVPNQSFHVGSWKPSLSRQQYDVAVDRLRNLIYAGDTYQVNFSIRLHARFQGDPYAFFYSLCRAQRGQHCAFVNLPEFAICSASPELFFVRDGNRMACRPMKGTARRGLTWPSDQKAASELAESEKNRAENVMIVDMVRNDLGRIADPGTVRVKSLFEIERFPTVLQMTSTVTARTTAGLAEVVRALFPCASITGAPKVRTMEIIRDVEDSPRGVYTGMIGYLCPGRKRDEPHWKFNVAIRTAVVDKKKGMTEYGVGGGVVWDSSGPSEHAECVTKASVLTADIPEFQLMETIRWSLKEGYYLLSRHMARLESSARYFGFHIDISGIAERLRTFRASLRQGPCIVRLLLDRDGTVTLALRKWMTRTLCVAIASRHVRSLDVFLHHKTTAREVYESARADHPDVDDVILLNERGEITESTIANVVIEKSGRRLTPPVECGLLAGTFRAELLDRREVEEAVLCPRDLHEADSVFLVNSVRGWICTKLVGERDPVLRVQGVGVAAHGCVSGKGLRIRRSPRNIRSRSTKVTG